MAGLRILHAESSKGWGGQENRTLNELLSMRERGHELAVVGRPGARILDRVFAGEKRSTRKFVVQGDIKGHRVVAR